MERGGITLNQMRSGEIYMGGRMIKQLEQEIQDLQKTLAEVQRELAGLRLEPCRGDSEIREKDAKFDELDGRAKILNKTIRDLTRKRQLAISESTTTGSYDSRCSGSSS
jgi:chromosome segregation ATPase